MLNLSLKVGSPAPVRLILRAQHRNLSPSSGSASGSALGWRRCYSYKLSSGYAPSTIPRAALKTTSLQSQCRATASAAALQQNTHEEWDDLPITSMDENRVAIGWDTRTWSRFHHIWLRDHCRCSECFHPTTMQRLLNTFEIPPNIHPISVSSTREGLKVVWPAFKRETGHEHESLYPWSWLKKHSYDPRLPKEEENSEKKILWGSRIAQSPPSVAYEDVMKDDKGLLKWLTNVEQFGFCFVAGVPPTPEATEELARRIAFIRETHYGRFWEFTSDLSKGDTAYTDLALDAHTDNTYFTDPCGLQLFHLLSHTAGPEDSVASSSPSTIPSPASTSASHSLGGATLLVDGFYVASILRELHPEAYHILSTVRVPAHAAGERDTAGIFSTADYGQDGFPVLTHAPSSDHESDSPILAQIRWNNSDRSVLSSLRSPPSLSLSPSDLIPKFYSSLRLFHKLLTSPDSEYWVQLQPGTAVIVDNWRVLHGRGQVKMGSVRRMCGAYLGMDDVRAKGRGLRDVRGRDGEAGKESRDGERGEGVWSGYC